MLGAVPPQVTKQEKQEKHQPKEASITETMEFGVLGWYLMVLSFASCLYFLFVLFVILAQVLHIFLLG